MSDEKTGGWRAMDSADRSGQRILVTVRGGEQGPAEVDTVRWAQGHGSSERCWIATDIGPDAQVTYEDDELLAWMPLPMPIAGRTVEGSADAIQPALESDFLEQAGSGI